MITSVLTTPRRKARHSQLSEEVIVTSRTTSLCRALSSNDRKKNLRCPFHIVYPGFFRLHPRELSPRPLAGSGRPSAKGSEPSCLPQVHNLGTTSFRDVNCLHRDLFLCVISTALLMVVLC